MIGKIHSFSNERKNGRIIYKKANGEGDSIIDFIYSDLKGIKQEELRKGLDVSFEISNNKAKNIRMFYCVLPRESEEIATSVEFENYGLMYNKVAVPSNRGGFEPYFKARYENYNVVIMNNNSLRSVLKSVREKYEDMVKSYFMNGSFASFTYKPDIRLIIGTGSASPYSNVPLMTFHHIYGIPYIPASTIKGIVRSYVMISNYEGNEREALKDREFCRIFGSDEKGVDKSKRGIAIFLDAFPETEPKVVFDHFTPHYQSYYTSKGEMAPVDYDKLNLLDFPAVEDTSFKIYFGLTCKDEETMARLKEWFMEAVK